MTFQQLKYFIVLAEKQNSREASDVLFITQQGLNSAISKLEKELGYNLFTRTDGRCIPNEDGELFRKSAEIILAEYDKIGRHFTEDKKNEKVITLVTSRGCLSEFVTGIIAKYKELHPDITFNIKEFSDFDAVRELAEGRGDLGFCTEPINSPALKAERVFECVVGLLVNKNNPLAYKEKLYLKDLDGQTMIAGDNNSVLASKSNSMLAEYGIHVTTIGVEDIMSVHRLVQMGKGVGFSNASAYRCLNNTDVVLRTFEDRVQLWPAAVVVKKDLKMSPQTNDFYQFVSQHYTGDNKIIIK